MTRTDSAHDAPAAGTVADTKSPPFDERQQEAPIAWETCVHSVIQDRCRESPESVAVLAWDGSLTYGELDDLSSNLASALILLGARPEISVPICMEKSLWTTVAILGVMKSGGVFTLLDPSHPLQRLQAICQDLSCSLILASQEQSRRCAGFANVLVVDALSQAWRFNPTQYLPPLVDPSNALYVAFTSGSTGKPKGIVIEHRAYCSGARDHLKAFNIDHTSRVLQFAAYAFDVSIMETLSTLMAGACLCVPSQSQRIDMGLFSQSLRSFRVSHAFLTPSFARTVTWEDIPSISTLILGGESMRSSDAAMYASLDIRLMNAYGPAECAVNACVQTWVRPGSDVSNIGRPTGAVIWITHPDDPQELMAPGTVGEMLIEGPIVGRGYLNNSGESGRGFIDPPLWLQALRGGAPDCRVYRTGDLASQGATGSLKILGRKDGQVKIRGQRIELGEIEHHVHQSLANVKEVIVEKISRLDGEESLVAFVLLGNHAGQDAYWDMDGECRGCRKDSDIFLAPKASLITEFCAVQQRLEGQLPRYMIPVTFIPLATIPKTVSGKIDRILLRTTAAAMPTAALGAFTSSSTSKRGPVTEAEREVQRLYAEVLAIPVALIGMDDNFLHLGGNSILAIRLVGAARKAGLSLYVQDLLGRANISFQAQRAMVPPTPPPEDGGMPFSMLRDSTLTDILLVAQEQCGITADQIEDIYPCSALQEGMFAMSLRHPGMYAGDVVFRIPEGADLGRLKDAWQATAAANPILRSRIIQTARGVLQVVVADQLKWHEDGGQGQEGVLEAESRLRVSPGEPLLRFRYHGRQRELVLSIHHSIWDDWSLRLVRDQVEAAYRGTVPRNQLYQPFIQYTQGLPGVDEFWSSELAGLEAPVFPALPSGNYQPSPNQALSHVIERLIVEDQAEHTPSTYIYLAWAVLVAHYTDSTDVLYGITVSGRNAPVAAIDQIVGPTIATVPLRTRVEPSDTVSTALGRIHDTLTRMIPFEQAGLQNIAKCNPDTSAASAIQTQLVIQLPADEKHGDDGILHLARGCTNSGMDYTAFTNSSMLLVFRPRSDMTTLTLDVVYDDRVLSAREVESMVHQFEYILRQICRHSTGTVGSIPMAGPHDLLQLQKWNAAMPAADDRCLQDLTVAQYRHRPQATAVAAWDGSLTYAELISLSSSFAHRLNTLGVSPGSYVAICLERSRWSVVAILAVLRAGATCILIDPQYPRQRIHDMLQHTETGVLIHSETTAAVTTGLCLVEVLVSTELIDVLRSQPSNWPQRAVSPEAPAFIIFTSGSTGRPKGIVMPHRALSTSIRHHSPLLNVDGDSRVLHFSSYAFDLAIYEIFTTWAVGGTLCIPSEFERKNDLAGFIQRSQVNWALLTPSAVQTLRPSEVPSLSTLVLAGEAVSRDNVDTWAHEGRILFNGYGPAEATICGVGRMSKQTWKPGVVGHIIGGLGWVTLPSDPSRLAAVGAIGELLLEGPFLAQGYLNLPDVTEAAFMKCPDWRHLMPLGAPPRLYRTGDLVQYQPDGSIRYIGRRDTRVKLRGQMVDLGEVETGVLRVFPASLEVVAEVVVLGGAPAPQTVLVAFIKRRRMEGEGEKADSVLATADASFRDMATRTQGRLGALLPAYMVPSMLIPVYRVPKTMTGKVDRHRLREAVKQLSRQQLQNYIVAPQSKQPVSSDAEKRLQGVWADVLGIPREEIGPDDSFLAIGGDSITAMRMVAMVRRLGFDITVRDVLNNSALSLLARQEIPELTAPPESANLARSQPQQSMLASGLFQEQLKRLQHESVLSPGGTVTAVSRTTEAQSFLATRYPWSHFCLSFHGQVDGERLQEACRVLVEAHSVLRAVFLEHEGQLVQLTLQDADLPFRLLTTDEPLKSFCGSLCHREQCVAVSAAGQATRFTVVSNPRLGEWVLMLRLSHAQYDGSSLPRILADLETVYNTRGRIPGTNFDFYLDQRRQHGDQQHVCAFWQDYLAGADLTGLPPTPLTPMPPVPRASPETERLISQTCSVELPLLPHTVTLATVVKAASCIAIACLTGRTDIVIGQTLDGRSLPFAQVDQVAGPCINYVPFRVTLRPTMSAHDYLHHAHAQHTQTLGHESLDLADIVEKCTSWAKSSSFTYIVQHQTVDNDLTIAFAGNKSTSFSSTGRLRPASEVWICSTPSSSSLRIDIVASSQTLVEKTARDLADAICAMILDLVACADKPLTHLDGLKWE